MEDGQISGGEAAMLGLGAVGIGGAGLGKSDEALGIAKVAQSPVASGKWINASEHMSARAAAYQEQITGAAQGTAFLVGGVKFDGVSTAALLEAKGPGYAKHTINGQFKSYFSKVEDLVKQARSQIEVANGVPIQWNIAEPEFLAALQNLFRDRGISGIQLIHVPSR
jgi:hypothetical protein